MNIATIAYISVCTGITCLLVLAIDVFKNPQKMRIMNLVWPLTGLYAGPLSLLIYFFMGRQSSGESRNNNAKKPFWQSVLTGALHCGSGCTLGDLIAANLLLIFPVALFGSNLYGEWTVDFVFAFFIGIVFQYYAIKPMGNLTRGQAIIAALKADTLSLTFWQIGMYGWMAICDFLIFGHMLKASSPVFWMMMQIGMLCGLVTAYPVNWWLIRKGIKEAM